MHLNLSTIPHNHHTNNDLSISIDPLQILTIPPPEGQEGGKEGEEGEEEPYEICYDLQWLAIVQKTNQFLTTNRNRSDQVSARYIDLKKHAVSLRG